MLIVKKFGGTSVANKDRIFNAVNMCLEDYRNGNDIIVVVSAMGKYTDDLISMSQQIGNDVPKREMDMLFAVGEQISAALMAMAFDANGIPAISLNAFQVGIKTDNNYGDAKIINIDTERIKKELSQRKIVIITGFQGIDEENNLTTLGRGGSDTTAVALAATLNSNTCEIYTDVNGVYTADPKIVENAIKLDTISYDEMLEFSNLGAGVLHNKCVRIAKENDIKIMVMSSLSNERGTVVTNIQESENKNQTITGITANGDVVSVVGKNINDDIKNKIIEILDKNNIGFINMNQTKMKISITIAIKEVETCIRCLHNYFFS